MFNKYKSKIVLLLLVGNLSFLQAQVFKATDVIATNAKIKKGVLANGMTYYIYPTKVNKNTASYYIIQNVGSILENDQQKGLAHFLEHMAFNGTKNFEGKGILNTLQKQGAIFGKNINAYTSFDETVYNLDNIPSQDAGVVDTCLLVLHDWSNFLSLTNEEIDAERGVITEEWRSRQTAGQRINNQLSPFYYNNSLYADRKPIGEMHIINTFQYQVLKDFYKDWYRPDLQAIAVVGDIDAKEIEAKIIKLFSDIPKPKNPKKRFEVAIPVNEKPTFKLALDKEITSSSITLMIRHEAEKPMGTFAGLEKAMARRMAFSLLNNRLAEMAQQADCPFKSAQVSYQGYTRLNDILYIAVSPKPDQQAVAFTAVMNEWMRASKFGFADGEIQRAVIARKASYENYLEKLDEISHKSVINMVKGDFLKQDKIVDPKAEFEMVKVILQQINSNILKQSLADSYTKKNRVVTVTGVENESNLSEQEAFAIIANAENNTTIKPYVDTYVAKSLMDDVKIVAGKIVKEKYASEIDATTYTLSNGVKVNYKFADKNKKSVELKAESYGGMSLYEPADMPSAARATSLAMISGVANFSNIDLEKMLKGKNVSATMNISNIAETVSGSANSNDLETMLQLIYLRFERPRFDQSMYDIMKQKLQIALNNKDKDLNSKIKDSMMVALYGNNNPRIRTFNQKYIDDVTFEKMQEIYKDRFADVSNFEFNIVGDVSPEVLKPLLEKYIASISGIKRKESYKVNPLKWQSNKIDKDLYFKMETPKSTVNVGFYKEMTYSQKNRILAAFLGDILTLRYTESLREKEGGTYGASVRCSVEKLPVPGVSLDVTFDCDPAKDEQLLPIVYQELENIKKGEILIEDLEKTRINYLKSRADSKNFNSYNMNVVYNYFKNNYNMNDPKNYEDIVNKITARDIQEFAKTYLERAASKEILVKPIL